jgi:hypothetical protein
MAISQLAAKTLPRRTMEAPQMNYARLINAPNRSILGHVRVP